MEPLRRPARHAGLPAGWSACAARNASRPGASPPECLAHAPAGQARTERWSVWTGPLRQPASAWSICPSVSAAAPARAGSRSAKNVGAACRPPFSWLPPLRGLPPEVLQECSPARTGPFARLLIVYRLLIESSSCRARWAAMAPPAASRSNGGDNGHRRTVPTRAASRETRGSRRWSLA